MSTEMSEGEYQASLADPPAPEEYDDELVSEASDAPDDASDVAFCPECGTQLENAAALPAGVDDRFCDAQCARRARARQRATRFADKRAWRKVSAPEPWRPRAGDVLYGTYVGRTEKHGPYGAYGVVLVRDLDERTTWILSGVGILNLVDVAQMREGQAMAVTFVGRVDRADGDGYYKRFELRVAVEGGSR